MENINTNPINKILLALAGKNHDFEYGSRYEEKPRTIKIDVIGRDEKGRVEVPIRIVTKELDMSQLNALEITYNQDDHE